MKTSTFILLSVTTLLTFCLQDSYAIKAVHYNRTKHNCSIHGCNNVEKTKELVSIEGGGVGWAIDINCSGSGWSFCPKRYGLANPPDNDVQIDYLINYIESQISGDILSGNEYKNLADQNGVIWIYHLAWLFVDGTGNDDEEINMNIELIGEAP